MPQLDRKARVADVIHVAIADAVERLHEHEDGARRGGDPEDVHQARVAARRLRSDLKTFHAFCDPEWTSDVRAELAWLGGELGAVRDIEVLLQRLRADERALPDSEQDAAERVVCRLLADWEGARTEMLSALASPRYNALRDLLDAAVTAPNLTERATELAVDVVPGVVQKPWRKLKAAVTDLGDSPADEALHELRIMAKRTRYAAEAAAAVFGKRALRFAKRVAEVQDVLGEHQDAVVARAWLAKTAHECSAPEAFAAGMLAEREAAAAARARADFPAAWAAARAKRLRTWL